MRMLAVLMAVSAAAVAQTSSELDAKYGHPEHSAYTISPDARLIVTYGDDQRACHLELRSTHKEKGFASEVADRVLNDLAPPAVRSGNPRSMLQQMSCAANRTDEHSNLAVSRLTDECKKTVQVLVIEWRRPACGNLRR
jgi:hypothetical protein